MSGFQRGGFAVSRAWLLLAAAILALAAIWSAIGVLARVPGLSGLRPLQPVAQALHPTLTTLWLLAFAAAWWRGAQSGVGLAVRWTGLGLAAAGAVLIAVAPFLGGGPALLSNYVPALDRLPFFVGLGWFLLAGAAAAVLPLLGRVPRDGLALGLWAAALVTLLAGVSLSWSLAGLPRTMPPDLYYESLSWGPGHFIQFAFVALALCAWLELARAAGAASPLTERIAQAAFWLTVAPVALGVTLHLLYPPDTVSFRKATTLLMVFGSWLGALPLGAHLLWGAVRARGMRGNAARPALLLAVLLFAAACMLGAFARSEPGLAAHAQAALAAVTFALMAATPLLLDGTTPALRRAAYVFAAGAILAAAGPGVGDIPWLASVFSGLGALLAVAGSAVYLWCVLRAARTLPAASPASPAERETATRPAERKRPRDARPRAMALAFGLILMIGLVLSYLPPQFSMREMVDGLLTGFQPADAASHVVERRQREIDQRFRQGVSMLHAKQYEHAVTAFHRVLALHPRMPEAHVNMGFALLGLGDPRQAHDFFESATQLRRDQANAYYGMAIALEEMGDLAGAIGAMRTFVHRAPKDDPYRRKAQAALWEWEEQLKREREQQDQPGATK